MPTKPTKPKFGLTIEVKDFSLDVEIESETLETALADARNIKIGQLLQVEDNVTINDYTIKVDGVYTR